jgi:hypothetical protein
VAVCHLGDRRPLISLFLGIGPWSRPASGHPETAPASPWPDRGTSGLKDWRKRAEVEGAGRSVVTVSRLSRRRRGRLDVHDTPTSPGRPPSPRGCRSIEAAWQRPHCPNVPLWPAELEHSRPVGVSTATTVRRVVGESRSDHARSLSRLSLGRLNVPRRRGTADDHSRPECCCYNRVLTRSGLWRSLVSALDWGSRGPGFKSRQPDDRCRSERFRETRCLLDSRVRG